MAVFASPSSSSVGLISGGPSFSASKVSVPLSMSSSFSVSKLCSPPGLSAVLHIHKRRSNFRRATPRCALTPELRSTLDSVITSHKVLLFMKGSKEFPQCGFSNTVVQILNSCNVPFETIDILENEFLRQGLKEYSSWPTFPQLYIGGEFFGGCDITLDAYRRGELQELLEKAMCM